MFTLQGWSRRRYEDEGVNETASSHMLAEQPGGAPRHRAAKLIARLLARISPLSVTGGVAWLLGVVCRADYALHAHAPRHYVTSDVMPITVLAETLVDPSAHQRFLHTIWPPGMPAFLALNLLFDPTLGSAAACQLVMSCLVPLMVAHCAYVAFGRRAGWLALVFASLHFGFIHYVGFYWPEQLFQFATSLAIWTSCLALLPSARPWQIAAGAISGLAWGVAFAIRPNALPIALFVGVWLALRFRRRARTDLNRSLAAGLGGLMLVVIPLAHRCTSLLRGRFCMGSINFAMNVALGHGGEVSGLCFKAEPGELGSGPNCWNPPSLWQHGYREGGSVPASIYDTLGVLGWVKHRFVEHPIDFVVTSIGNSLDMFSLEYVPTDFGPIPIRWVTVMAQVFGALVLVPGVVGWAIGLRDMARRRDIGNFRAFFVAAISAMLLLAACSMGEARYRAPFDALFIVLAAGLYAPQATEVSPSCAPSRSLKWLIAILASFVTIAVCLLIAVAHPRIALAQRLSHFRPLRANPGRLFRRVDAAELENPKEAGADWNSDGTIAIGCGARCRELRLDLGRVRHATYASVSTDHSDRYRMVFYRDDVPVAALGWGVFEGETGLHVVELSIPARAADQGYDEIGIQPMYGDSLYSVGHVVLTGD